MTLQEIYHRKKKQNPALEMLTGIMRVTGKSSNTVRLWIKGVSVPSFTEKKAIAEFLGVQEDELFNTSDHECDNE